MMQERKPKPGDLYCHFKGNLYEIILLAIHSETEEEMVVYRQKYGEYKAFVRPLSMFLSEVDHEKYPEVRQKYRFELVAKGREENLKAKESLRKDTLEEDNILFSFLEAATLKEKLELLEDYKGPIDALTITNMAISVDVVVKDGSIEHRLEELKDCLRTLARFECTRLR